MTTNAGIQLHMPAFDRKAFILRLVHAYLLYLVLFFGIENLLCLEFNAFPLLVGTNGVCAYYLLSKGSYRICALAIIMILSFFFLADIRDGLFLTLNRLFTVSESTNRYVYHHFSTPDHSHVEIIFRSFFWVFSGILCVYAVRYRIVALFLAFSAFFIEIYFGVAAGAVCNIAFFTLIFLALVRCANLSSAFAVVCIALLVSFGTIALAPGVNPDLEASSEIVRDHLASLFDGGTSKAGGQSEDMNITRKENRLTEIETTASDDAISFRDFEKLTRYQDEISAPQTYNLRKVIVMLLLVALIILAPFVPFYFWDQRKRKAIAARSVFSSDDSSVAIQAIFRHLAECMTLFANADANAPISSLAPRISETLSSELSARFENLLPVWHKAAYSNHQITSEEAKAAQTLLNDMESAMLSKAALRMRLKLRYIHFLQMDGEEA